MLADFYALPHDEQVRRLTTLARTALPRLGLPDDAQLGLINYRENAVFRVGDADGQALAVIRLHRPGYQTRETVRSELAWMKALDESGISTPQALRTAEGDTVLGLHHEDVPGERLAVGFPFLEGQPPSTDDVAGTFGLLGALNARLHGHARGWTPPASFTRHRWDVEGLIGPDAVWGRYSDLQALGSEQRALLDRARARVVEELTRFGTPSTHFGLVHGDMMPDNVLVHEGTPRIIDFDDCGYSWHLYDLATLLAAMELQPGSEGVREAWIEGYRTVAPLDEASLRIIDALMMARRLVIVGWLHTRSETLVAQQLTEFLVMFTCDKTEAYLAS